MKINTKGLKEQIIKTVRSTIILSGIKISSKIIKEIITYIQRKLYLTVEESLNHYYRNLLYEWLIKIDEEKYKKTAYNKLFIRNGIKLKRGIYFLKYKQRYILINNLAETETEECGQKKLVDQLKLYIFGKNPEEILLDITNSNPMIEEKMINYSLIQPPPTPSNRKLITGRDYNTVFSEQKDEIIAHMQRWINQKSFYKSAGAIYKDGILIHGKPGCGKSSMAKVLASLYNATIYQIDASDPEQTLKCLSVFNNQFVFSGISIIIIEEIDYPLKINSFKETFESKITQLLDGISSPPNAYFYFTTNDISVIPKKWLRFGRLSKVVEMTYINKDTALKACDYYKVDPNIILKDKTFPTEPAQLIDDILNYINQNKDTDVKMLVDQALNSEQIKETTIQQGVGITNNFLNG